MDSLVKAEQFLLQCIRGGLAHSYDTETQAWVKPYPEVTGYLVSYFSDKQQIPNSIYQAADKLLAIQHPLGGFSSFFNTDVLYTFDTAQIAHGLASLYLRTHQKRFLQSAVKAGEFVLSMQWIDGSVFPMFHHLHNHMIVEHENINGINWGSTFSAIQVKNIQALLLLSKVTKDPKFYLAAKKLASWGERKSNARFSHPYGYFLEGMYAFGEKEFILKELNRHIIPIDPTGFIPYTQGGTYAYVSGSIQLGILLAKVGHKQEAKLIFDWALSAQEKNLGGLFQYANKNFSKKKLVHSELNSWGTKYLLELAKELSL